MKFNSNITLNIMDNIQLQSYFMKCQNVDLTKVDLRYSTIEKLDKSSDCMGTIGRYDLTKDPQLNTDLIVSEYSSNNEDIKINFYRDCMFVKIFPRFVFDIECVDYRNNILSRISISNYNTIYDSTTLPAELCNIIDEYCNYRGTIPLSLYFYDNIAYYHFVLKNFTGIIQYYYCVYGSAFRKIRNAMI